MGIQRAVVCLAMSAVSVVGLADDDGIDGTVVSVGRVPLGPVLEGAGEVGNVRWRGETLTPTAPDAIAAPTEQIADLHRRWVEADFSGCLAKSRTDALDPTTLFVQQQRDAVAAVLAISAGCALGAGDRELASSLLSRAMTAELDMQSVLSEMTTDLQRLADALLSEVRTTSRVTLTLQPRPSQARVFIDGRSCASVPCVVDLLPGEHVIVATRLGYLPRVQPVVVEGPETRVLTLDPAPSSIQRRQLAETFTGDVTPGDLPALRTAAGAFGTPLLLTAWRDTDGYGLALFDRRVGDDGDLVARGRSELSPLALQRSARSLVAEWADLQPRSVLRSPWFWVAALVVIGAAVAVAVVVTREPERNFALVGR